LVKNKGKDRCKVILVHVMKAHRGSGVQFHVFLTSTLDGGDG